MPGRIALDTNILVYASGIVRQPADSDKAARANRLIRELVNAAAEIHVAAQALIELHDVLVRKGEFSRAAAETEIARWRDELTVGSTDDAALAGALEASTRHNLRIFDAVILSVAARTGCDTLYSEDLQAGFVWRGVEVVNPFL